ncbi:MAG: hypothetical protein QE278_13055 [Limnobacter sp.]|nr:hypothetical protein [Limnobacter sp.]
MIELLFQWLLIPAFMPGMVDQSKEVQTRLEAVHMRLSQIDKEQMQFLQTPANLVSVSMNTDSPPVDVDRPALPRVTGRVLGDFWVPEVDLASLSTTPATPNETPQSELALRGVLKVGNSRVAIVSQGDDEHVLGVGSYLMNKYQVREIGPGHVQLHWLKGKGADVRLTLSHASGALENPNNLAKR